METPICNDFAHFHFTFFTVTDNEQIQRYFARFDETFFVFCDKELLKINTFFSGNCNYFIKCSHFGVMEILGCLGYKRNFHLTLNSSVKIK